MVFQLTRSDKIRTLLAHLFSGVALVGVVLSCATVEEEKPAAQVPAVTEAPHRPPVQEKPADSAKPQEKTLAEQPFRLEELSIRQERGQTLLHIKFSQPVNQYRHFPLAQPSRVVLDIFGEAKTLTQVENFRVDTNWIGTLRLSSGEGYLRLVAEIAAANVPPYAIEPENGGLKVTVGPVDPKATGKKELRLVQGGKRTDIRPAVETKPATPEVEGQAPTTEPEARLTKEKKYTGQRISLDFKDADIRNVFRLLAEVSGLNIIVTDDVRKRVTVRLVDVPWDQALDLLIDTNGLGKEQIGNVLRISTAGQIKSEKDALLAAQQAEQNLEPLQTAYLSVNYAKVGDLVDKIKPSLSPRGTIVADERSNTIIVRDIQNGIEEATTVVSRLDTRTPQVLIESNLIETTPTFARSLGAELDFTFNVHNNAGRPIDFDSRHLAGAPFAGALTPAIPPTSVPLPSSGMRFGVFQDRVGSIRNLNVALTAAESEGNIKIISRPSVVTLNNVESNISSLQILRITLPTSTNIASGSGAAAGAAVATEKINVGIILTVKPQVSSDGFILMNIKVKSSSISPNSLGGGVVPFDELSREAISNVLVRDGETIVIGGIMKDTSATSESGVPYLKDIPILGWLFKNIRWQKDFEELMVFITPRIVSAGSQDLPTAEELWREQLRKTQGG